MRRIWQWWWGLVAAAWLAPAALAADVSAADARQIRGVIQAQLKAFAADDSQRAFALAAPKIRAMFGDAERFIAMVRLHYPVVYRPANVEFMVPERVDGQFVQSVRMTDAQGTLWLAVYHLERQPDKSWRIGGCEVAQIEGRVA